jgi:hypothetical protein
MSEVVTGIFGGLFELGRLTPALPTFFGNVFLDDGIGTRYRFESFGIRDKLYGVNVVYAFAVEHFGSHSIKYIGKANILSERINSHERLAEAIRAGANRLLVHTPTPYDRVSHEEAEKRLIRRYSPSMNTQHTASNEFSQMIIGLGLLT